ncbi:MAG: hypothetical protein OQK00_12315 [Rhodobacteraceae bacterium]|nr:hypothetical protein [Paracoccaceae bacterium]
MFGKYAIIWQRPFLFISAHPILHEVSRDIHRATRNEDFSNHSLTWVFCGAHKPFPIFSRLPGRKLFIQTEQLTDREGRGLWGQSEGSNVKNIIANLEKSDVFLDLNNNNGPFYERLQLRPNSRSKIFFGPHVFPSKQVSYNDSGNGRRIFFGGKNDRRKIILEHLQQDCAYSVLRIPGRTFGHTLRQYIENSSIILNIHFSDAVYTEVPRTLAAYLSGKPIQSEPLEAPFESGVHYVPLDAPLDEKDSISLKEVFENFSSLVSTNYSFKTFVDMAFEARKT